jgi:tetratricopeptide (TPR) repeat protein
MERGRLLDALRAAEALEAAAPRDPNVVQLLGMIAGRRHRFDDAARHFTRLAELVPADPMARCRIGMSCMYAARFDEAEAAFARALELRPGFPAALRGRAELLERRGAAAAGLEALGPLLADPREAAEPATRLLHAQLLAAAGDHAAAADTAAAATSEPAAMPPAFLRKLHFIRGRSLDRLGPARAADAAEAWTRANATGAMPFDAAAHDADTDAIIARFSRTRLARTAAAGRESPEPRSRATSELPILVVGMPRSGSTLAEQILAAHEVVGGAGETTAMPEVMADLARTHAHSDAPRFPTWWDDVDEAALTRAGLDYVQRLEAFRPTDRTARAAITRMVDKNLLNLSLVGAIAEMLPGARFLICRRDPVDNGFSCWINDLSPVGFPWSGDLAAIGRVAGAADRLTEHWAQVLPARVRVLDYEAMVADPEGSSRELLAFAGLDWDEAVLRFHETGRAVTTLSYDQVRQPIYRSSVRRSDRYRPFLEPMIEAMRAAGLPVDPPTAAPPDGPPA